MTITRSDYESLFEKAFSHYTGEISSMRSGKASVQLLDSVQVEAYGSRMRLQEVASVTVSDPTLLTVSPWDKGLLGAIEKAIQQAQLNLNPIVDSQIVRVPVPPLTRERRQELVKVLHQKAESARVMMRNVRVDIKKDIEKAGDEPGVSEDDVSAELKTLDEVAKHWVEQIDAATKAKESELLTL